LFESFIIKDIKAPKGKHTRSRKSHGFFRTSATRADRNMMVLFMTVTGRLFGLLLLKP